MQKTGTKKALEKEKFDQKLKTGPVGSHVGTSSHDASKPRNRRKMSKNKGQTGQSRQHSPQNEHGAPNAAAGPSNHQGNAGGGPVGSNIGTSSHDASKPRNRRKMSKNKGQTGQSRQHSPQNEHGAPNAAAGPSNHQGNAGGGPVGSNIGTSSHDASKPRNRRKMSKNKGQTGQSRQHSPQNEHGAPNAAPGPSNHQGNAGGGSSSKDKRRH
ncbi:hypothetical protein B0H34DRAFT_477360 [Crassisporium funariophilum]|nr:hypothetical protein B0H34DRAFT_477360 [Crassisporium funariophilum]